MKKARATLLDVTRQTLESEVAKAACRVQAINTRLTDLKEETKIVGFDLVSARADLRVAVTQLETHDARRAVSS